MKLFSPTLMGFLALAWVGCARAPAPDSKPLAAARPVVEMAAAPAEKPAVPGPLAPAVAAPEVAPKPPLAANPSRFSFTRTAAGKTEGITFDDIKLELKKDEPYKPEKLTARVKELNGRTVRLRGWILPTSVFTQRGIKQFVLVRDNQECCFGPGAALHDCVMVELETGHGTNFTSRPIAVEGVFSLDEVVDPDSNRHLAIYHMQATSAGE